MNNFWMVLQSAYCIENYNKVTMTLKPLYPRGYNLNNIDIMKKSEFHFTLTGNKTKMV